MIDIFQELKEGKHLMELVVVAQVFPSLWGFFL
jgi:hypothetical protein